MADYTKQIATALRLIAKKGATFTLTRYVDGSDGVDDAVSPPENPWDADLTDQTDEGENDATTTYTASAVVLPYSAPRGSDTLDAAEVSKMRWFIMAASGCDLEPRAGDTVTVEGKVFSILGMTPLNPDGQSPIIYKAVIQLG